MKHILLPLLLLLPAVAAIPQPIDDQRLLQQLTTALGGHAGEKGIPTADALAATARESKVNPVEFVAAKASPTGSYEDLSHCVYLIGTVYQCGKCDEWHRGAGATAWCVGSDGVMVTNAHVFLNAKGAVMGVSDREGNCYPVTGLLSVDETTDVAVFRVKADGLVPLKLAESAAVGDAVTIISHPAGHHFMQTGGAVARYVNQPISKNDLSKVLWMSVTADYAKGSSGGPIFNPAGEVVGMVARTVSLYTGPAPGKTTGGPKGDLQMVVHHCVPVETIKTVLAGKKPEVR